MEGFTLLQVLCTSVMFWFLLFLPNEMNYPEEALSVWLERLTVSKMTEEGKPQNILTYFIIQKFCNQGRHSTTLMEDILVDFT